MLIGDFNTEPTKTAIYDFCEIYNLANIVTDTLKAFDDFKGSNKSV